MRTKVCYVLNILGISTMFVSFVSGAQDCVMAPTQVSVYLNRWESFLHNRQKKLFLQSDCANYKYPHADANLGMLCMHMSSMTGCSLRKQCKSVRSNLIDFFFIRVFLFILAYFLPNSISFAQGGAKGSLCNSFSLLADVCRPSEGENLLRFCKQSQYWSMLRCLIKFN